MSITNHAVLSHNKARAYYWMWLSLTPAEVSFNSLHQLTLTEQKCLVCYGRLPHLWGGELRKDGGSANHKLLWKHLPVISHYRRERGREGVDPPQTAASMDSIEAAEMNSAVEHLPARGKAAWHP